MSEKQFGGIVSAAKRLSRQDEVRRGDRVRAAAKALAVVFYSHYYQPAIRFTQHQNALLAGISSTPCNDAKD
jgi:hypothetical protein